MALSKTEAIEINQLLRWVLYGSSPDALGRRMTEDAARDAAAFLAERADKALMAGLRREDVEREWERPS